MKTTINVISGKYYKSMTLETLDNETIKVTFPFDRNIIDEVKMMEGARWNPDSKYWTIKKTQHNQFALEYLSGKNPFAIYDAPLIKYESKRKVMNHQLNMTASIITKKQLIIAGEQGVGKTLAAIEAVEYFKDLINERDDFIWVGPKSALQAVELEFLKWRSVVWPRFVTYDSLKKCINIVPKIIIFDEASKLKTPTAQRTQAARLITGNMRNKYGNDAIVVLMSGTPAPNSPADWWSLAAVARPGFLKEGNFEKFKRRLGLILSKESMSGGIYPELITWFDDENKCRNCGKPPDALEHILGMTNTYHEYAKSVNEVKLLYERLKGLTVIHLKKDVLKELPDKHYRIIKIEPSEEILRAAKLILASAKNVVTANVLLRELSDGFQYKNLEVGTDCCPTCNGRKVIIHPVCIEWKCENCGIEGEGEYLICPKCENPLNEQNKTYADKEIECLLCNGEGEIPKIDRSTVQVANCPKDQVLIDLLDEYEEGGRFITYAGFTGSVDRIVKICLEQKWDVIRVDGRGWWSNWGTTSPIIMLKEFLKLNIKNKEKIVFIGQTDAAGMGLTLTSSPAAFYFSNTFKAESRMQSEDRGHRIGMDLNKGFTIIDVIHLPSDQKVLDALKSKKDLQSLSLGEFKEIFIK